MLHYNNDTRLAARVYPAARAYAEDVIAAANKTGGLLRSSSLGDWCALWRGGVAGGCAFGGPDLATLYITSARFTLSGDHLAAHPHEGGLFALDVGARGLAPYRFGETP